MTEDERQIRELVAAWMDATKAGDVAAMLALMTDDIIFMTPGRPPFGKAEFAANAGRMPDVTIEVSADIQEIEVSGDRAYLRNHIQIILTQPGQPTKRMSGFALGVLRKEADGHWRLARDANLVMPEAG
jgi:uncharacterized protein (TIGR02246 family)